MLERIRLKDWKSFVDEEVELAPLTLLVGANASGKSNFLDAIRVLRALEVMDDPQEILDGEPRSGIDVWPGIRGGAREAARIEATRFVFEAGLTLPSRERYVIRLVCQTSPRALWENVDVWVERDGVRDPASVDERFSFYEALACIGFLDIQPRHMRRYGRRGAPLGEDGSNISGVLADLCRDPEEKRSLVEWLRELCAPEIVDLDFIEVPEIGDVMAVFVEQGGRRITARSLSDGTLRFLGLLVALRTARPGSVILLEEIESELHPTRIRLLVEYLQAVTRERDVQIIATTHSPVVLQWLDEAARASTIVFGRVPEREGTLMRRLQDLPYFTEVVQNKGIEELFTTGWLEMAL